MKESQYLYPFTWLLGGILSLSRLSLYYTLYGSIVHIILYFLYIMITKQYTNTIYKQLGIETQPIITYIKAVPSSNDPNKLPKW